MGPRVMWVYGLRGKPYIEHFLKIRYRSVQDNIGKYIRLEQTVIQPFGHVSVGVEVDGTSSIADAVPYVRSSSL